MEQYLMWMEGKNGVDFGYSRIQPRPVNSSSSWEEQAFAEDLRGPLGGFVWPPRSYSCTFCRREFRSAQALGGHMNVHRRDRARLKQSLIINQNGSDSDHQITTKNGSSDLSRKSTEKSQVSSLDSGSNNCKGSVLLGHDECYVETNLCVGWATRGRAGEGSVVNFKRQKASPFDKLDSGCSKDSIGGVDLELRLGSSPQLLTKTRVLTI